MINKNNNNDNNRKEWKIESLFCLFVHCRRFDGWRTVNSIGDHQTFFASIHTSMSVTLFHFWKNDGESVFIQYSCEVIENVWFARIYIFSIE